MSSSSAFNSDYNAHICFRYVNQSDAIHDGLFSTHKDQVSVGVDNKNTYITDSPGRKSVRLESKVQYSHGLFVLNLTHMPWGCGTWPAFRTGGLDWPNDGVIEIIEGANNAEVNTMSLHTSNGCSVSGQNQTGSQLTSNCYDPKLNVGCLVKAGQFDSDTNAPSWLFSYGYGFNNAGGGTYVMEWTSDSIKIWYFPQNQYQTIVPASLLKGRPTPDVDFGQPYANFQGACNIPKHFFDHRVIIDTSFCGDYGASQYQGCPMMFGSDANQSCVSYVAQNPEAFREAYWGINSFKVYQLSSSAASQYASTSVEARELGPSHDSSLPMIHDTPTCASAGDGYTLYAPPGTKPRSEAAHTFRIYCHDNVTDPGVSTIHSTSSKTMNLVSCIASCDEMGSVCIGAVFSNGTAPIHGVNWWASCALKGTNAEIMQSGHASPIMSKLVNGYVALRM